MRRWLRNGARAALELGPKLESVGVASLTLHPRSAQQMYTGSADHTLTAELVDPVWVRVIASGDFLAGGPASRVRGAPGAAAGMVARAGRRRPGTRGERAGGEPQ